MSPHLDLSAGELFTRRTALKRSMLGAGALALAGCSAAHSSKSKGGGGGGGGSVSNGSFTVGALGDLDAEQVLRTGVDPTFFSMVFDTFVGLDPKTGAYTPSVASSWQYNADKTKLTVNLRPDVVFHSGRKLEPEDAIFSIKALADPTTGAQVGPTVALIKAMRVTGPHQFVIELHEPLSMLLNVLLFAALVDRTTYKQLADAKRVIGTGPFVFKDWQPGRSFSFTRNPHYWGGTPHLDKVTVQIFSSEQALTAALRASQIGLGYGILPSDAALLAKSGSLQTGSTAPNFAEWYISSNVKVKPLGDIRVRQAIAWALDRDRIAKQAFSGFGRPSCIPWTTQLPGVTRADETHYRYDAAKAKALVKAAGAGGATVPLVSISGNSTATAIVNIVQYNLSAIGLKVKPQQVQQTQFATFLEKGTMPGLFVNILGQTFLPLGTILLGNAPVKVGENAANWTDPRYKTLADKVISAASRAEQASANAALTRYFLDTAWHISIGQCPGVYVHGSNVSGVGTSGPGNMDLLTTRVS